MQPRYHKPPKKPLSASFIITVVAIVMILSWIGQNGGVQWILGNITNPQEVQATLLPTALPTNTPMPTATVVVVLPPSVNFTSLKSRPLADATLVRMDPIEIFITQGNAPGIVAHGMTQASGEVADLEIPEGTFQSPCGKNTRMVESDHFRGPPNYSLGDDWWHPGHDGRCPQYDEGDRSIYSAANAIVWKQWDFLSENTGTARKHWASGGTIVLLTRVRWASLPSQVREMLEPTDSIIIMHVYGHFLANDGTYHTPKGGEIIKQCTLVGMTGSTGLSTGDHLHYGTAILLSDGTFLWVNPVWFGA
jgi:hypothetical protein